MRNWFYWWLSMFGLACFLGGSFSYQHDWIGVLVSLYNAVFAAWRAIENFNDAASCSAIDAALSQQERKEGGGA